MGDGCALLYKPRRVYISPCAVERAWGQDRARWMASEIVTMNDGGGRHHDSLELRGLMETNDTDLDVGNPSFHWPFRASLSNATVKLSNNSVLMCVGGFA